MTEQFRKIFIRAIPEIVINHMKECELCDTIISNYFDMDKLVPSDIKMAIIKHTLECNNKA